MNKTSIEWTDVTWNPTRGCSRVSQGCVNCYAERLASRFVGGTFKDFVTIGSNGPHWTGKVELIPEKLAEPLSWRKPRRCFVNSMSDLFHAALPVEDIAAVFGVMARTPHIRYQVLTKRDEDMQRLMSDDSFRNLVWRAAGNCIEWPPRNVDLGVSVEDEATAKQRIPNLLRTPAARRFVSYEPALGRVFFQNEWLCQRCPECRQLYSRGWSECQWADCDGKPSGGIDQVIIGGESGPGARPFNIEWAMETIELCKQWGTSVFVKQLGAKPFRYYSKHKQIYDKKADGNLYLKLKDRKGGDMAEWPEDLQVREQLPL